MRYHPAPGAPGARRFLLSSLSLSLLLLPSALANSILGVDLGTQFLKVALVQRNSPLEIVTNMHSKRRTEQMVLFDDGARFYGADAASLLGRKPLKTPMTVGVMLGRSADHPAVQVLAERHYPLLPTRNATRHGLSVDVESAPYTPEELVAMILNHVREFSRDYGAQGAVKDVVLTVPSFYTQREREALIDAVSLADYNVLSLLDENTAAALHYGIDRAETEDKNVLFYNLGASALQVSVATFGSYEQAAKGSAKPKRVGAFTVRSKAWDATLGGLSFDHRIVEYCADQFNGKHFPAGDDDVRKSARAMTKLRIQAKKIKEVLSANSETSFFIEGLYADKDMSLRITRAKFEEIASDLFVRAAAQIDNVLSRAGLTLDDIHEIELVGGGMRVPKIQEVLKEKLGGRELGMHINSDESMALGAAFHGANVSTAFRVRHVGMTDVNPFPIGVELADLPKTEEARGKLASLFGLGKKAVVEEEKEKASEDEEWTKKATVFKSFGKLGVKKTIAFTHDTDVHCAVRYDEDDLLPIGTEHTIANYEISGIETFAKEMDEKQLGKPKVTMQFELSGSGICTLLRAEAAVEEMVEVEEEQIDEDAMAVAEEEQKVQLEKEAAEKKANETEAEGEAAVPVEEAATPEVPSEEETNPDTPTEEETVLKEPTDEAAAAEPKEGEETADKDAKQDKEAKKSDKDKKKPTKKKEEPKPPVLPKIYKTVLVEKKKVHKRALDIHSYYTGALRPMTAALADESRAKLANLNVADDERKKTEGAKNDLEAYIYFVRNKLADDAEHIDPVTTEEEREALVAQSLAAEDWLYDDGYTAGREAFEAKYEGLHAPMAAILVRVAEVTARPAMLAKARGKLTKVGELLEKWQTTKPQVNATEVAGVRVAMAVVETALVEREAAQAEKAGWDVPAYTSQEIPALWKELEKMVTKLNKKPKPLPPKNETAVNETAVNETETVEIVEEAGTGDAAEADTPAAPVEEEAATEEGADTTAEASAEAPPSEGGEL